MATIQGKWKWNDIVNCNWITDHPGDYAISFESNGTRFSGINTDWMAGYHALYYFNENTYVTVGESKNEGDSFYTVEEAYRIMDFGETEQDIDHALYQFITDNAEPYVAPITPAEKLVMIAENQQKVYDAGYVRGEDDGYTMGLAEGKKDALEPFEVDYLYRTYISPYALCSVTGLKQQGTSTTVILENLTDKNIRVWLGIVDVVDGIVDDQYNADIDLSPHEKLEFVDENGGGVRSALLMGAAFI